MEKSPRGEIAGLITEEDLGSRKYHISIEVPLCRRLLKDRIRRLRKPGGLSSTNAAQCYDKVVNLFASLEAYSFGIPLPTLSMLLSTIHTMELLLRTGFGDLEHSYGVTN